MGAALLLGVQVNDETMWRAVHRMDAAADAASRAADRMEEAARRIAHLLEDGYGGNGLRLIEALENARVDPSLTFNLE